MKIIINPDLTPGEAMTTVPRTLLDAADNLHGEYDVERAGWTVGVGENMSPRSTFTRAEFDARFLEVGGAAPERHTHWVCIDGVKFTCGVDVPCIIKAGDRRDLTFLTPVKNTPHLEGVLASVRCVPGDPFLFSNRELTVEPNTGGGHLIVAELGDINRRLYLEALEGFQQFTDHDPNYQSLSDVLTAAYDQAASGKGAERHGQDLPFEQQPMQQISTLVNSDAGMLYQAIKKLQESQRMGTDAAIRERLGAINYIAGSIIWLRNQQGEE